MEFFPIDLSLISLSIADTIQDPQALLSEPLLLPIIIGIGFIVGAAIGMSGIGGAPLLLPSLVLLGIPPQLVVGTDLAFIFLTKLVAAGAHSKERNVNWKTLVYLVIPVVPAMILASFLWTEIKTNYGSETLDTIILLLLGTILIGVTVYLVRSHILKENANTDNQSSSGLVQITKSDKAMFLGLGGIVSFITQITATGAGAMILPALVGKFNQAPKYAAGTSVFFGVAITAVGALLHYSMGNVPIYLVILLLCGSIPGVLLGVRLSSRVAPKKLISIFTVTIFVAAVFLISKGIGIV